MAESIKSTSVPAVANFASSGLEVHPDTQPPPFSHQNNQKKKGDDDVGEKEKEKSIITGTGHLNSTFSQLEEHGVTQLPPAIIANKDDEDEERKKEMAKKNSLDILGAQENASQPTLIAGSRKENNTSVGEEALQFAPATGEEMLSPSIQITSNLNLGSATSPFNRQSNTGNDVMAYSNREEEKEHEEEKDEEGHQLFIVEDAFRVLTPEEQRQQRLERERQNLPLFEGQVVTSRRRRPSLTPSQQEATQKKKENRRLVILFFVCAIVLAIVLVPSLLLTNRNNTNNAINSNLATISPSPSPSPSAPLMPSFSPSVSIVPSSFPTTSSPTSTTFDDVVSLLGLDGDSLSLNPDDYVFRSVQWMVERDQVARAILLRQEIAGTEQQERDAVAALVQRFALVCLYFATQGDLWFDRLEFLNPFTHECEWRVSGREQFLVGETIVCVDNTIVGIALNDNNLGGMIPSEIGLLTGLLALELERNEIEGTLPSLSRLSRLQALYLERNKLSGSIPSKLTTFNNLLVLWLRFNDLTGSIPKSIGDLTNLRFLSLSSNLLNGMIPSSIQNMTMLRALDLSSNMLTSTLPREINKLQQLEEYYVSSNLLNGTLPFEAGANPSLEAFGCNRNDITKDISRLTHLSSLTSLIFSFNRFTGTIPTAICSLSLLRDINGAINMLTGSLPDCLSDLTLLTDLFFARNNLVGSIPKLPTSLEALVLWRNQLTGRLPAGPFPNMMALNLFANNFTAGTIPTELGTLTKLNFLSLLNCRLTGTIPTEIGLSTQLTALNLGNNTLFGTIPSEIGMLQNLGRLQLSVNELTGTIPSEMGRLTSLQLLGLNGNLLTGSLPSTFVNFPVSTLGELALQGNNLMGDVQFFCQDRTFGFFLADCQELTNCTCCTGCCDPGRSAIVDNRCEDIFNNL